MVLVGGDGGERLVVVGGWIERELTAEREREKGEICRGEGDIQFFFFFMVERDQLT